MCEKEALTRQDGNRDYRAASSVAALLGGALAAERRCPPLEAERWQAQQGAPRPWFAVFYGEEASYGSGASRVQLTRDLLGSRVCRYRAPSGVKLAQLSQRGHSTTG
jgi:hypothetical protein